MTRQLPPKPRRTRWPNLLPGLPHFAPKAKRVVCLWQGGGPSHIDLFDPKPTLAQMAGKDIPDSIRGATRLSTMSSGYKHWPIVPAIKPFKHYGKCGLELSELLAAHRLDRRRHLRRPLDEHRSRQPRARA